MKTDKFKVVKCLGIEGIDEQDYTQIVINGGKEAGVHEGDKFVVYSLGSEVMDPDTGESLGQIEIVKGKGKIVHVQEKMSTLESIEKKKIRRKKIYPGIGNGNLLGGLFNVPREEIIDDGEESIIPFNDPQIGDIARRIV